MNLAELRQEYTKAELSEKSVAQSPFEQFDRWFKEALHVKILEPNAMILGTTDETNQSVSRTVLLKAFDSSGFVFYTNYKSRKAEHLATNNKVSLLFPWFALERQVIILGTAEKVSQKETLAYFLSRPTGSQLGAWVSHQSRVISSRSILEMKLAEMKRKFKDGKIPVPDFWGGYRIIPHSVEFWQGRSSRLHDRIRYDLKNSTWEVNRISP